MKRQQRKRILPRLLFRFFIITGFLGGLYYLYAKGYGQYLTVEYLKSQQKAWLIYNRDFFLESIVVYFVTYVIITACSIPGAGILSLAGGAIFGLWMGTILVALASTVGATLAFLSSRFLFRGFLQKRFGELLDQVNEDIEKDGPLYLVTVRLIPAFPYFLVNLVMGLTPMKTSTYFVISLIGMLPATFVYVNAGTQLAQINSVQDILSWDLLLSFALLGVFPFLAKALIDLFKIKRSF